MYLFLNYVFYMYIFKQIYTEIFKNKNIAGKFVFL